MTKIRDLAEGETFLCPRDGIEEKLIAVTVPGKDKYRLNIKTSRHLHLIDKDTKVEVIA